MRFIQDGPSIPDELLIARDEGRVVFFCGAGVSRARANLFDFFGLADNVIQRLRVPADNAACRILKEAREIGKRLDVSLISADRIFGLLERDFRSRDIDAAVAQALKPDAEVNLSAHRILLDLARTPEGRVRLVTTNFDRLFEQCEKSLRTWQPPRLPDPSRPDDLDGIVHLHGRVTEDYGGSEGDGFVLSSSEFGNAYLSDGWATRFFKEIIERYVVIFVGYAADDPPVQYLLEALNKKIGQLEGVYALQSGTSNEASARWQHKGIQAIPYSADDGHYALWRTLEAWADRAKAPEAWHTSVIDLARKGPGSLQPHERGQVAHLVSTAEGARRFADSSSPPGAEWLCVFDPTRRYAKPGYTGNFGERGPYVDPFDLYGLDSDELPKRIDPDDHVQKRDVPPIAWDAFAPNRIDRQTLPSGSFPVFRGYGARTASTLPSRLIQLGDWLAKVAHEPASVWWGAYQHSLHPVVQAQIEWQLRHPSNGALPTIRRAWQYLFEFWENKVSEFRHDWYKLKAAIKQDGWDNATIRRYAEISRPYLAVERSWGSHAKPPEWREDMPLRELMHLDVKYPDRPNDVEIPNEWLGHVVRELRKNLELASHLELELGGYGLSNIAPIVPDDQPDIDLHGRAHGLSGCVIQFSHFFIRLADVDLLSALKEFAAWPSGENVVFDRLRIWASGDARLVSEQQFGEIIASLSDDAFWESRHQRDLLIALEKRWNELSRESQERIEDRLLKGPCIFRDEERPEFEARRAWYVLNRLVWLSNSGCSFSFNFQTEIERLQKIAPDWMPDYAKKAADSMESRGGWVRVEPEYSRLLDEPISTTLSKAAELTGRSDNFLERRDPFAGLSNERPVRAFAALNNRAKQGEYPDWAWNKFLESEARKKDNPKLSALIAERLCGYPDKAIAGFVRPASDWLFYCSTALASNSPIAFDNIVSKLIQVLRSQPTQGDSAIVRGDSEPDWTMEAINAPAGKIAEALFNDTRTKNLKASEGLAPGWIAHVSNLLSLGSDLRRHALVIFAHNMNWLFAIDPGWTESNLLSVLEGNDENDRNAVLAGFFWGATTPNLALYVRMKPTFLALAKKRSLSLHKYDEVLAGIILAGWATIDEATGDRYVSNGEMHDVLLHAGDDFRSQVLWHVERWSETASEEGSETWSDMLPELLLEVWPRQKIAKTPEISARLCQLAFSSGERFPQMAQIIQPLLTTVGRDSLMFIGLQRSEDNIVERYPRQTLEILYTVLPDNVAAWPYETNGILQQIGETDATLKLDERYLELMRRWNAR